MAAGVEVLPFSERPQIDDFELPELSRWELPLLLSGRVESDQIRGYLHVLFPDVETVVRVAQKNRPDGGIASIQAQMWMQPTPDADISEIELERRNRIVRELISPGIDFLPASLVDTLPDFEALARGLPESIVVEHFRSLPTIG